jgi:hypothetical protein
MKTIYTTLPIYDSPAKQCYVRGKNGGQTQPVPIISPRTRLPSWQYNVEAVVVGAVTDIDLVDITGAVTPIEAFFPVLSDSYSLSVDTYYKYDGDTLNTPLTCGLYYLEITHANGYHFYSEWFLVTEVTNYLTINFSNGCDLGDILYKNGFTQTLWLESETMETSFPTEEEGQNNGEGRFVRTFARQVKKYNIKTMTLPDFLIEVLYRLKLHDTIQLIDLVGNVNDVYNLEVEHEWLGDDKYYATASLTFDYDEAFIIGGCCSNLT